MNRLQILLFTAIAAAFGGGGFAEPSATLLFDDYDYRTIKDYDFESVSNSTGSAKLCLGMIVDDPECFGGELVYAPKYSGGILQISSSKKRGYLTYAGDAVSPENTLFIRVCKASGTVQKAKLSIDSAYEGTTNSLAELSVDYEMAVYEVPLTGTRQNATLIFQPNDNVASSRQFLIDTISFARKRSHGFCIIIR